MAALGNDPGAKVPTKIVRVAHYEKPAVSGKKKEYFWLGKTAFGSCEVQVAADGGENNLHSHVGNDGFWFVLKGRVRFYTTDDVLVAEVGENEGFVTPRRFKYWFECDPAGGDMEMIRLGASTFQLDGTRNDSDRINHENLKENQVGMIARKDELPFELLKVES